MTRAFVRLMAALMLALAGFAALAPESSAHERRSVAGKYTFVVGFDVEPVFLEQKNAALLRVTDAQTNQPVEGIEKTLKVEITNSGQSKMFDLKTRANAPGTYIADVVPTKSGSWVFRFEGSIDGTPINERFESGPGRFNEPQPLSELEFPVKVPSNTELAQQIQTGARPAEAGMASAAVTGASEVEVQRALDKADDAQRTGTLFGVIGIIVGLLGLAVGGYALVSRRNGQAPRPTEPV